MYLNTGLPKIFSKKRTGIVDIIVFIIKYCLLLDTSELFVNEKMEFNGELNMENSCKQGFDLVDFFTINLSDNRQKILFGGSETTTGESTTGKPEPEKSTTEEPETEKSTTEEQEEPQVNNSSNTKNNKPKYRTKKEEEEALKQEAKLQEEKQLNEESEKEFEKQSSNKNKMEAEIDKDIKSKANNSVSIDTGKTGEESISSDLIKLITDTITEGTVTVSNKVKGFIMIFVYASVYPAVPFFAVMAVMFATLKYIFYKIRIF